MFNILVPVIILATSVGNQAISVEHVVNSDTSCQAIFQITGVPTSSDQSVCNDGTNCTSCCSYNTQCCGENKCCNGTCRGSECCDSNFGTWQQLSNGNYVCVAYGYQQCGGNLCGSPCDSHINCPKYSCCSTGNAQICCPSSDLCTPEYCCPSGYPIPCGDSKCCKSGSQYCGPGSERCCDAGFVCVGNGCMPSNAVRCGNAYCDPGNYCCNNKCCPTGAAYCGNDKYCDSGHKCCDHGDCCNEDGENCCGDGCCGWGWYCDAFSYCLPGAKKADFAEYESELDDLPVLLRGRFTESMQSSVLINDDNKRQQPNSPSTQQQPSTEPRTILTQPDCINSKAQAVVQQSPVRRILKLQTSYNCLQESTTWTDPCNGFPCFIDTTACRNETGYLEFFGLMTLCQQQSTAKLLDAEGQKWWNCTTECATAASRRTLDGNAIPCCNSIDQYGLNTINVECMINQCNFCSIYEKDNNTYALQQIFQSSIKNPYWSQILEFISYCKSLSTTV